MKSARRARKREAKEGWGPAVRSRAWIEWNGQSLLGQGRLQLLEQIASQGSISAASRAIGVSYRLAWKWIEAMNGVAGDPLIETATGGRGGGGATLTPLGQAMLEAVRVLTARRAEFDEQMTSELRAYFNQLRRGSPGPPPPARPIQKRRPPARGAGS